MHHYLKGGAPCGSKTPDNDFLAEPLKEEEMLQHHPWVILIREMNRLQATKTESKSENLIAEIVDVEGYIAMPQTGITNVHLTAVMLDGNKRDLIMVLNDHGAIIAMGK
jgi:hypothetical protein